MSDTAQRLDGVKLLECLTPDERRDLERRCRWRRYNADEQILDKDSDDRDVYFVIDGSVQIVNFSMSGREIALAKVGAGGFFGELSAIDGAPRSASVVAVGPSLLASLAPRLFLNLVTDHADIAAHVLQRLAGIVRSCDERIMDLSTLGAVQRVYVELLRLADENPDTSSNAGVIKKMPTHKTIASRASTTRETVARSMSQLVSGGIIERRGTAIHIVEREKLEKMAGALAVEWDGTLSR